MARTFVTTYPRVSLTQKEYDRLTEEQKNDGTIYTITDKDESDYYRLKEISDLIGPVSELNGIADGTIFGAIKAIYDNLGDMSFKVVDETHLEATHEIIPYTNRIPKLREGATDEEKLLYLESVLGDPSILKENGYKNLTSAVKDIYNRLAGLKFSFDEQNSLLQITN